MLLTDLERLFCRPRDQRKRPDTLKSERVDRDGCDRIAGPAEYLNVDQVVLFPHPDHYRQAPRGEGTSPPRGNDIEPESVDLARGHAGIRTTEPQDSVGVRSEWPTTHSTPFRFGGCAAGTEIMPSVKATTQPS